MMPGPVPPARTYIKSSESDQSIIAKARQGQVINPTNQEIPVLITAITRAVACALAAGAGIAIALAPVAAADPNPVLPYGTNPQVPSLVGPHTANHDELDTTNGRLDLPF
ncbi:hypothetical protein [Mycolicibacterium canariasense]|uniref:hypothetical protein n=1 Tax=Mycolicibacterium canariasense TaxID=228230 RepID=UPI000A9AE68E|nr:hypothetical protein [Mycolicibacterium canariasense]